MLGQGRSKKMYKVRRKFKGESVDDGLRTYPNLFMAEEQALVLASWAEVEWVEVIYFVHAGAKPWEGKVIVRLEV